MKGFFAKIKTWYEKIRTSKVSYTSKGIKPVRDWQLISLIWLILFVISITFASYLYVEIDHGKIFTVKKNDKGGKVVLNSPLLQKIADEARARKIKFDDARNGNLSVSDPSL